MRTVTASALTRPWMMDAQIHVGFLLLAHLSIISKIVPVDGKNWNQWYTVYQEVINT